MSTKALRELVQRAKEGLPILGSLVDMGLMELHDIEQAAKTIDKGPGDHGPTVRSEQFLAAIDLLTSIAKDAP